MEKIINFENGWHIKVTTLSNLKGDVMTEQKSMLQEILKRNPRRLSSRDLYEVLGLSSSREIRTLVNALRREQVPICSDEHGYFYSDEARHLFSTLTHLRSRVEGMNQAIAGLQTLLNQKEFTPPLVVITPSFFE